MCIQVQINHASCRWVLRLLRLKLGDEEEDGG